MKAFQTLPNDVVCGPEHPPFDNEVRAVIPFELVPYRFYKCKRFGAECENFNSLATSIPYYQFVIPDLGERLAALRALYTPDNTHAWSEYYNSRERDLSRSFIGSQSDWDDMNIAGLPYGSSVPFNLLRLFQTTQHTRWPLFIRVLQAIPLGQPNDQVIAAVSEEFRYFYEIGTQHLRLLDAFRSQPDGMNLNGHAYDFLVSRFTLEDLRRATSREDFTRIASAALDAPSPLLEQFVARTRMTPDQADALRRRVGDDQFFCPICYNAYGERTETGTLVEPCAPCIFTNSQGEQIPHHFCAGCVPFLTGHSTFDCPVCKVKTHIPREH